MSHINHITVRYVEWRAIRKICIQNRLNILLLILIISLIITIWLYYQKLDSLRLLRIIWPTGITLTFITILINLNKAFKEKLGPTIYYLIVDIIEQNISNEVARTSFLQFALNHHNELTSTDKKKRRKALTIIVKRINDKLQSQSNKQSTNFVSIPKK